MERAALEDELVRQRLVSAANTIAAFRLKSILGSGCNGAVARMTFTAAGVWASLPVQPPRRSHAGVTRRRAVCRDAQPRLCGEDDFQLWCR
jgi:hypothetical protein